MTDEVWILTEEYNDYDQHGEYFREVFFIKPTETILMDAGLDEHKAKLLLKTGTTQSQGDWRWYALAKHVNKQSKGDC